MKDVFTTEFGQLDTSESILSDATAARQMSIQNASTEDTKLAILSQVGDFLRNFNTNSELISSDSVADVNPNASDVTATSTIVAKADANIDPASASDELDESLRVESVVSRDKVNRRDAINKLEEQFTFSHNPMRLTDSQIKYIRSFKSNLHKRFNTYDDLIEYCNDYTAKGGLIDAEEYLTIHTIYTMPHPEQYVDYFTYDLFSEDTMHGGILYFINNFKKSLSTNI